MLGKLAWQGFAFTFGVFNLVVMVGVAAVRDRAFTRRESKTKKKELAVGMLGPAFTEADRF